MFAYCNNNPVKYEDTSGHFLNEAMDAFLSFLGAYCYFSMMEIAEQNYIRNSAIDADPNTTTYNRKINDQNGATGDNFQYGYYMARHNGCEAIAIHNAKILIGMDSTLSQTMYDCQLMGAIAGYGFFGSNPYELGSVLNYYGISYTNVQLDEMNQPGTYIISFWNDGGVSSGLHTVAVFYDGTTYTTYNLKGDGQTSDKQPSTYVPDGNFICGYYVG